MGVEMSRFILAMNHAVMTKGELGRRTPEKGFLF